MTIPRLGWPAATAWRLVLSAGFLLMLAANLPGHMSYDSIVGLFEGRFHVRVTWAPAFYSWVLGVFDAVVPGTSLYVIASGLLLFASIASFASLRGRVSWWAVALAAAAGLTPNFLIYQAIVWKDVFFANLGVAALVSLAHAARTWDRPWPRWGWLAATVLLLAAAALTRQNGIIVAAVAAVAAGWIAAQGRWLRGLAWGAGGFAAVVVVVQVLGMYAVPTRVDNPAATDGMGRGLQILRNYDLVGAVALEPTLRLDALEGANPTASALLRADARNTYSAERVDTLKAESGVAAALAGLPDQALTDAWVELITERPDVYLRQRLEVFRWVFLTPAVEKCLPVWIGIEGPADRIAALGLPGGRDAADVQLYNYNTWFLGTPVVSHLAYAVIALAVAGVLAVRRDRTDIAMLGLMVAALGFTASFFFISLACDYRYLYFLDVAAVAGLIYLAVDPRLKLRPPPRG
ncbi:hypothetical protein [Phenylobacterium sp.]|uniref:hypothetical protein n=1 Tax=Phenylobacterium sp. TaxID=1871053 RepID=UPI0039830C6D